MQGKERKKKKLKEKGSDNLSIAVHALRMHTLTSLSVDEIWLPKIWLPNWSTNFRLVI